MKEITVDAIVDNIGAVTEFVEEFLESFQCPIKTKLQMNIVIDELLGNICRYAYQDQIGQVTIGIEKQEEPEEIILTIIDSGIPYNPLEKGDPDTTLSAEDREIGGLGIYMVKKSVDELAYRYFDGKNQLVIKKSL